ncbi:MAG: phosphoadenosine phosphosulfate reductase family protein, partial [Gammaproteobacteria bacterium]
MTPEQVQSLNQELAHSEPRDILARVLAELPNCTLAFSGAEDVVLLAMAVKLDPAVKVFTLDTGRLHPETYKYLETVRETYGIEL